MESGKILKMYRTAKGMTQEELARAAGYAHKTSISKIEKGEVDMNQKTMKIFADILGISPADLIDSGLRINASDSDERERYTMIPLYGEVAAGLPIFANPDILGHIPISDTLAIRGNHFALTIRGTSMEPKFFNGDIIVVREQSFVEFGQIGVVQMDNESATCKKVKSTKAGLELHPLNPAHDVQFYTKKEVAERNITVLGLVIGVWHQLDK